MRIFKDFHCATNSIKFNFMALFETHASLKKMQFLLKKSYDCPNSVKSFPLRFKHYYLHISPPPPSPTHLHKT